MMIQQASWIAMDGAASTVVPVFRRKFSGAKGIWSAALEVTCDGVYEARLNGERIGNFILAPGWTEYRRRQRRAGRAVPKGPYRPPTATSLWRT